MKLAVAVIGSSALLELVLAPAARGQVRVFDLPGERAHLRLGAAVAALGDVDLDGVPDFLVGSDPNLSSHYGQVEIVSGRTGSVLRTLATNIADDGFGSAVKGVGDLNSDGVPDVVVGSPSSAGHDAFHLGGVRAYSGRDGSLLWFVRPSPTYASTGFGRAIADIGDVDGDGIDDIAVGPCTELVGNGNSRISVHVLSGQDGSTLRVLQSSFWVGGVDTGFGSSVAGPGDIDGDGCPDILVGAPLLNFDGYTRGSVFLYSGRTGGFLREIDGTAPHGQFGNVARLGDIDHDGTPDFLVGAPTDAAGGPNSGSVWILSGRDSAVLRVLRGNSSEAFGSFLADAADVNGDGFPDIAVGAPLAVSSGAQVGAVRVYSGRNGALLTEVYGQQPFDYVGPCAFAGDLNGDGVGDLVAGVPGGNGVVVDSGTVSVYLLGYEPPAQYCQWKWNSQGCGSSPTYDGAPSLSLGAGLTVNVDGILNRSPGYLVWGLTATQHPFGGGILCLRPLTRGQLQDSGGNPTPGTDCTGTFTFRFSGSYLAAHGLTAGTRVFCQFVYRDDGFPPPNNVGLSEGLAFTVLL